MSEKKEVSLLFVVPDDVEMKKAVRLAERHARKANGPEREKEIAAKEVACVKKIRSLASRLNGELGRMSAIEGQLYFIRFPSGGND